MERWFDGNKEGIGNLFGVVKFDWFEIHIIGGIGFQ